MKWQKQEETFDCRIPMFPDKSFYVPLTIPIWGLVEPTHMHIGYSFSFFQHRFVLKQKKDDHLNFVFHAASGRILGASAYPGISKISIFGNLTIMFS